MAEGVVTRVFVRHHRDKCFREKRSRCLIRECPPIIAAIPSDPVVNSGYDLKAMLWPASIPDQTNDE
jgi:hypothetical protein